MIISGKVYWAKILGNPVPNYFEPEKKEWSVDLAVDEVSEAALVEAGVSKNQFKTKDGIPGKFLTFKRYATTKEGTPAKPYVVVDDHNNDWDRAVLIGNGTEVKASVVLNDGVYKGKKTKTARLLSLMVWELVPYKRKPVFEPRGDAPASEARSW